MFPAIARLMPAHRLLKLRWMAVCLALWTAMLCTASNSLAADRDAEFLAGLRARRLHRLAALYCQELLAKTDLPPARREALVVELSRTYAAQAIELPPAESSPVWQQAIATVDQYAAQFPKDDPRTLLVRVQKALVHLARGELLRRQAEVTVDAAPVLEASREQLRLAVRQLEPLAAEAAKFQIPAEAARLPEGAPEPHELFALEVNLNYQLARAWRNLGHGHPPKSIDRTDALQQALARLKLLAQRPVDEPLGWTSRLDQIQCIRLLEDFRQARTLLDQLTQLTPPPAIALEAQAERLHLALDAKQVDEALALAGQGRTIEGRVSPELDYAILEALLAGWKAASDRRDAANGERLQRQASQMVARIRGDHGPYWGRRADTLEASIVAGGAAVSGDFETLVRAAENFYRNSQFAEAVKAYDSARQQAAAAKQRDRAFDLGYTAAAIQYQQKQLADAEARFLELARDQQAPKARQAHLAAIGAALETAMAGRDPSARPDLTAYAKMLAEHLQRWPEGTSAGEAHWRLGEYFERDQKLVEAINHYSRIPADHARFATGLAALERTFDARLAGLRGEGNAAQAAKEGREAAEWFERLIVGARGAWPEKWSVNEQSAALAAARLWMSPGVEQFDRAGKLLTAALAGAEQPPQAWLDASRALAVVALAGGGQREAAGRMLEQMANSDPAGLLATVAALTRIAESRAGDHPQVKAELAALQAKAVGLAEPARAKLTPAARKTLDLAAARALVVAGKAGEAQARYAALAKAYPDDGEVQEEYAQALVASNDPAHIQAGLTQARAVEKRTKAGTPRWFRVRYYQALALKKQGKQAEAKELILITRTLHPDLGGEALAKEFERIERGR